MPGAYIPAISYKYVLGGGLWVNVKYYDDFADSEYAKQEAEELLDKLNEP